uniref:Uncharacterized protein n=1 Tax=Tetraselmis sp. GSL018 TaxID=582737 RepID=A0A061S3Y5_9CHLO
MSDLPRRNWPRAYNITKQDMEASRLVFVSLKGSKPRRKVAVPVPDTYTYQQFADKVKQKLKLLSVGSISHAATGERLVNIEDLQDIDELLVEEEPLQDVQVDKTANGALSRQDEAASRSEAGADGGPFPAASTSSDTILGTQERAASSSAIPTAAMLRSQQNRPPPSGQMGSVDDDDDGKKKYVKRRAGILRRLQRLFPSMLAPGLPVTARDLDGAGRRRKAHGLIDARNFFVMFALVSCLATMLLLYSRVSS